MRIFFARSTWVALWMACHPAFAAPHPEFSNRRWTTANGLPQNKVESVLQSSDGYIWAGTQHGLARFDGLRFTVIGAERQPEVVLPAVPALAEDKVDRGLWIGTTAGLFRMRDHGLTHYTTKDGLPHLKVWKLLALASGELWMETEVGLARFKDGKFAQYKTEEGLPETRVRWLVESPDGGVWLGNWRWRRKYEPHSRRFVEFPLDGLADDLPITTVAFGRNGELFIGTEHGLYRGTHGDWRLFDKKSGLGDSWIQFILEDSTGKLWVGTRESGLHRLEGDHFAAMPVGVSASESSIERMCEDREGNLWLATREGLIRLQRQQIRALTVADNLADDRISTVYAGPDDTVWIGSGCGLSWVRDGRAGHYRHPFPPSQSNVRGLCMDDAGALWVGAFGLYQFREGLLQVLPGLADLKVQSIYKDGSGAIWAGTTKGIWRSRGGMGRWFTTEDGLGSNGADAFLEDRAGDLWIGNARGLHRLHYNKITRFSAREGLVGGGVRALCEDAPGALWLGNENGLHRFADGHFFHFGPAHGLPEQTVHQILDDGEGHVWFSGLKGIHRASRDQLVAVSEGRRATARFVTFDEADGMLSSETGGGVQPAGCRTRDGRLWFPTIKGVAVLDAKGIKVNDVPPPVVIEQVLADGETIFGDPQAEGVKRSLSGIRKRNTESQNGKDALVSAAPRLGPGRGHALEIRFTANSLSAPEKVRFKYRLFGHDKAWREPSGKERVAHYTNLQPGDYNFQVIACNNHGCWNETGDSFAFSLAPKFTQTIWFPAVCVVCVVAIVSGFTTWRLRWQRRVLLVEQSLVVERERTRIANDLHDDLGSRLTALAMRAELAGNQKKPAPLEQSRQFARDTRALAERLRDVVWAADPACDSLEGLAAYLTEHTETFLETAGVRAWLDVPEVFPSTPIGAAARHHLVLVVKEALNNAIKHARPTEVTLKLRLAEGDLMISIRDNGRGCSSGIFRQNGGKGLVNMRNRVEKLRGKFHIESDPANGTTIEILLPVRNLGRP